MRERSFRVRLLRVQGSRPLIDPHLNIFCTAGALVMSLYFRTPTVDSGQQFSLVGPKTLVRVGLVPPPPQSNQDLPQVVVRSNLSEPSVRTVPQF